MTADYRDDDDAPRQQPGWCLGVVMCALSGLVFGALVIWGYGMLAGSR